MKQVLLRNTYTSDVYLLRKIMTIVIIDFKRLINKIFVKIIMMMMTIIIMMMMMVEGKRFLDF